MSQSAKIISVTILNMKALPVMYGKNKELATTRGTNGNKKIPKIIEN